MADAVEFGLRIFPFNDTLQQELQKLAAEGWQPIPNLAPAVTYVVFRNVVAPHVEPAAAGFGGVTVDETKVHVYRNGRLVGE